MSSRTNQDKALVQRYFDEVWNEGNLAVLTEVMASDVRKRTLPFGFEASGIGEVREIVRAIRTVVPDIEVTIERLVEEEGTVVAQYTERGTHEGPLSLSADVVIEPTGRQLEVHSVGIFTIGGDGITTDWTLVDGVQLLQQLGADPTTARKRGR